MIFSSPARGSTRTQWKAPFPYYGGKSRWAPAVWKRLGRVDLYSEPFAGSLAVLLASPERARREIVCDTNGHIINFWRAIVNAPHQVARWADYPSFHQDLTARHHWLIGWAERHSHRLSEDPHYFDAKAAGWWVWGISLWIGGGWCSRTDPGRPRMNNRDLGGIGVSKQRVSVQDRMPRMASHISGIGVSKQRINVPDQIPHVNSTISGTGSAAP